MGKKHGIGLNGKTTSVLSLLVYKICCGSRLLKLTHGGDIMALYLFMSANWYI